MSQTLKAQMQNLAACIAMTGWLLARVWRGCWLNCSIKGFERVFFEDQKNEDLPLASCFKTTKKGAPSKKTGPLVYLQLTWPVAVFSSFLHVCVLGAGLHVTSPGNELDKKKVPKVHLATNKTKGGKVNVLCRRDQLRFLKATEPAKFVDGVKEQLSDQQIGAVGSLLGISFGR